MNFVIFMVDVERTKDVLDRDVIRLVSMFPHVMVVSYHGLRSYGIGIFYCHFA